MTPTVTSSGTATLNSLFRLEKIRPYCVSCSVLNNLAGESDEEQNMH